MLTLNLPIPSNKLIKMIREVAEARTIDLSVVSWHQQQQPEGINCAFGDFFTEKSISSHIRSEYQHFFKVDMIPIIGIIKNTKSVPASYAPHSDRVRHVAINFYIDTGGDDVRTVFYDKTDSIDDLLGGHVLSYDNLPDITHQLTFESNKWYLLPTRQYHSVENIEHTRLILSLTYIGDVKEFIDSHKHLIIE